MLTHLYLLYIYLLPISTVRYKRKIYFPFISYNRLKSLVLLKFNVHNYSYFLWHWTWIILWHLSWFFSLFLANRCIMCRILTLYRLPRWLSSKESTCQCRRPQFDLLVGKIPWRRKWQPAPVFLPGWSHRQRNLAGYSPWRRKESDTTEWLKNNKAT